MEHRKIFELLKEKIIWLELMPETTINLSELAESFEVSRTPIKEALILLQAQGWALYNGSHFIVTPLSLDRIREITEIRCIMEVQGNVWAMHRITSEELAALCELEKKILQIGDDYTNKQLVELDVHFHRTLFQATKNTQLAELLERLLSHYLRFWLSMPREIDPKSYFAETLEIIRAIVEKDESKLRVSITAHIKKSLNEIMGTF